MCFSYFCNNVVHVGISVVVLDGGALGWECSWCEAKFKQGNSPANNIQSHVGGRPHQTSVEAKQSKVAQPAALTALAMLQQHAASNPRYAAKPLSQYPQADLRAFFLEHRCMGYYHDTATYNGREVDVTGVRKHCCHPGKTWFASPHHTGVVTEKGVGVHVEGTFFHKECEGIFCEKCPTIVRQDDFRMRVHRDEKREVPVGSRAGVQGVQYAAMIGQELRQVSRKQTATMRKLQVRVLTLARSLCVAQSRLSKPDLSGRATEALRRGQVGELVEIFRRCSDCGALDGKSALLSFLMDMGKNLLSLHRTDKANGFRYSQSTKDLFEMMWHCGGSLVHEFARVNLLGPSLNTSKKAYRALGIRYDGTLSRETIASVTNIVVGLMEAKGIVGPVPVEISEDETAIIAHPTYNRRWDTIDGFCGGKGENHVCTFDCRPSASSFEAIMDAFGNLHIASNLRVLILNVLHPALPRFPIAVLPTCMRFRSIEVQSQWEFIRMHRRELATHLGPIVAHASDGDNRRRSLMLQYCKRGSYGLDSPSFIFCGDKDGDDVLLMDQDSIHVAKKLRNILLQPTRVMMWGQSVASRNLIGEMMMYFPGKDEHGLVEDDISPTDVQNFPAVQRLSLPKVRHCLERMERKDVPRGRVMRDNPELGSGEEEVDGAGGPGKSYDCRGIIAHLYIMWCYLEVFFGKSSLRERVKLASFVAHMVYIGYAYILMRGHGHTVKENWMTRETMLDLLISVHFAVNLIRLFRDKFPHLGVPLSRVGTDCCEDFFSQLGQQTRNKHNATVGEALERSAQILRKEHLKTDDHGLKFAPSRRRQNLWWKGNGYDQSAAFVEACQVELASYESVSDEHMLEAWKEGLAMAQEKAAELGMKDDLVQKGKWDEPWSALLSSMHALEVPDDADEDGEGVASEGVGAGLHVGDANVGFMRAAVVDASIELEETSLAMAADGGTENEDDGARHEGVDEEMEGKQKISPTVEVPGVGTVYKMKLISELSTSPGKLPVDRLQRVRTRTGTDTHEVVDDMGMVGLYDNVAVFFVEKDADKQEVYEWHVGQVLVMTNTLDSGRKVDYRLPVSLTQLQEGVRLTLKYFTVEDAGARLLRFGGSEGRESDQVALTSVICRVSSLKYRDDGLYELGQAEWDNLDAFISTNNDKVQGRKRKRKVREAQEKERAGEGRMGTQDSTNARGRKITKFSKAMAMFL